MIEFDPLTAVDVAIAKKSERERQEEIKWQDEQRQRMHIPTAREVDVMLGKRLVSAARKALQHSDNPRYHDQLAEGLALQGQWHAAVTTVHNPSQRDEYLRVIAAIEEQHKCSCPETQRVNGSLIPSKFLKKEIVYDGKSVQLYYCTTCDTLQC